MSLAEKRFFFRSSSSFKRFELTKDISTPEKSAEAKSDIMITSQLLIFINLNSSPDAENLASREVFISRQAVAENNLVGTRNLDKITRPARGLEGQNRI